jgi:hypothetical protein
MTLHGFITRYFLRRPASLSPAEPCKVLTIQHKHCGGQVIDPGTYHPEPVAQEVK